MSTARPTTMMTTATTATTAAIANRHTDDVSTTLALAGILRRSVAVQRAIKTAERRVRRVLTKGAAASDVDVAATLRRVLACVAAFVRRVEAAFGPSAIGATHRCALNQLTFEIADLDRSHTYHESPNDTRHRCARQAQLLLASASACRADILAAALAFGATPPRQ